MISEEQPEVKMNKQEYNTQKEAIERKYARKKNAVLNTTLYMLIGSVLFLSHGLYSVCKSNPYKDNAPVVQYLDARETFYTIKKGRNASSPTLQHQSEKVKPYLEKASLLDREKVSSLDEAVKLIKSDLRELEQKIEVTSYKSWNRRTTNKIAVSFMGGIAGFLGSMMLGGYSHNLENNQEKELYALEARSIRA